MSGDSQENVSGRLTELEATVRGLTQELVSANERIRQLEAALEEQAEAADATDATAAGETDDGATKATPTDDESPDDPAPEEATPEGEGELDDIIVA